MSVDILFDKAWLQLWCKNNSCRKRSIRSGRFRCCPGVGEESIVWLDWTAHPAVLFVGEDPACLLFCCTYTTPQCFLLQGREGETITNYFHSSSSNNFNLVCPYCLYRCEWVQQMGDIKTFYIFYASISYHSLRWLLLVCKQSFLTLVIWFDSSTAINLLEDNILQVSECDPQTLHEDIKDRQTLSWLHSSST